MASEKLSALEYPRHVHRPGGASLIVGDVNECAAAIKDGWLVECPPPADSPLGMAAASAGEPLAASADAPAPGALPPVETPKKHGRKGR